MIKLTTGLVCTSIVLNALSAGGVFCFPMFSPSLASHLKLSQGQLSAISVAGMSGQYPFSIAAGILIDRFGPWASSLMSGIFFAVGFGLFSFSIMGKHEAATNSELYLLVFYYFLAGLGTVGSYFSALFAASKMFPTNTGAANGVVNALFGLSPLVLSTLGNLFFPDPQDGLDAPHYLLFLALMCGSINIFGGLALRAVPKQDVRTPTVDEEQTPSSVIADAVTDSETTPLLAHTRADSQDLDRDTILKLISDPGFILIAFVFLSVSGMAEMVIGNIGSIAASFVMNTSQVAEVTAGSQVRLISLSNTLSRLVTGPIADVASPIPIEHASGHRVFHSKRAVTRSVFLFLSSILILSGFSWMAVGITSGNGLWFLSVMTGAAYGMIFTVGPSIVEAVWGSEHAARNFGTLAYAPFLGTPIFSFLYAVMSDKARDPHSSDPICRGPACWRSTFTICSVVLVGAVAGSTLLWKRWKKLV